MKNFKVSDIKGCLFTRHFMQNDRTSGDDFLGRIYDPSKETIIEIPHNIDMPIFYIVPKDGMSDTEIQKSSKCQTCTLEEYWLMHFLIVFCNQGYPNSLHIFYVNIEERIEVAALYYSIRLKEWQCHMYPLNYGWQGWNKGTIVFTGYKQD